MRSLLLLWHVVVAVVPSIGLVLLSLSWAGVVQSDIVVLVVDHLLFAGPGLLHHVSSTFSQFLLSR